MMNGSNNPDDSDRIEDDMIHDEDGHSRQGGNSNGGISGCILDLIKDLFASSGVVLNNKLNWLLILGPIALVGDALGFLNEALCFAFSGLALIPCAERYVAVAKIVILQLYIISCYQFFLINSFFFHCLQIILVRNFNSFKDKEN